MSTLWFSLAVRDTVEGLQNMLGPRYLVLAYLDDIFVLAPSDDRYNDVLAHFTRGPCPVRLNPDKCKVFDLREVTTEPIHLLGSCIGSTAARTDFLLGKITGIESDLLNLNQLPNQHALLILRSSIQHKLRHLTRYLPSSDLSTLWDRLDASLWSAIDRLRGQIPAEARLKTHRTILSLPAALGGCGITSHKEIAPLAYQAASSLSATVLARLVSRLKPVGDLRTQRELCQEAALIKQEILMASLDPRDRFFLVESASQVGRRWLDVIPSSARFALSDGEIQANLHCRTLLSGYLGNCRRCAAPNLAGHDESCHGRQDFRVSRHESVKHALAAGLRSIPQMQVEVEPFLPDLRCRNDIRITLAGDRTTQVRQEFDLKVMAISAPTNQRSLVIQTVPADSTLFRHSADRLQSFLAHHAKRKMDYLPPLDPNTPPAPPFFPLVMTSGGIMEKGMFERLKQWRAWSSGSVSYSWMLSSVAVSLARARGRTFMM
jgi:hypothetical protein